MKVLLIGGSGQLGSEIRGRWRDDEIVAPSHAAFDLRKTDTIDALVDDVAADVVVNCAAFHNVDACEGDPASAFAVNAVAVDALARASERRGCAFVTISTDYVFDGASAIPYREVDRPHPLSTYATSKLAGEYLALNRSNDVFVVRTCGVYGSAGSSQKLTFVDRVIEQARAGEPIRVVDDVTVSPTYAGHLALALRELIATGRGGLYHAVNAGAVTWFGFAQRALELADIAAPIEPISRTAWKAAARRPAFSALENANLRSLGITIPAWDQGIASYLHDKALEQGEAHPVR